MRRLTQQGEGDNRQPVWTPDGEQVTFASDRSGNWGIYLQPADGSAAAEVLMLAEDGEPLSPETWSQDGDLLVFTRGVPGNRTLWTLRRGETEPERFPAGMDVAGASFSPDGNWLAYQSGETGNFEVFVQPYPPTGAQYQITETLPGLSLMPMWSRNGQELVFERAVPVGAQAGIQLVAVDIRTQTGFSWGSERVLPLREFFGVNPYRDYAITRDGQKILAAVPDESTDPGNAEITIVLNWIEELKQLVPVP
jgi:Tol biopolymer transport system component